MTNRKQYTAAFKAQIVQQVLREDKTLALIAAEHGVYPNQISQWKATALQELPTIFERGNGAQTAEKAAQDKQTAQLYEQIGRLTTQLAWIKKNLVSTLNRDKRLAFLERGSQDVPLSVQADLLTVSRASLYYQPAAPSAEELALKRATDELFTAHPLYGSRRSCWQTRRDGMLIKPQERSAPDARDGLECPRAKAQYEPSEP